MKYMVRHKAASLSTQTVKAWLTRLPVLLQTSDPSKAKYIAR